MSNQHSKLHTLEAEAKGVIHDMSMKARKLGQTAEVLEIEAEEYAKLASAYIKKNPLKSTLMAALAGIFIGKLL